MPRRNGHQMQCIIFGDHLFETKYDKIISKLFINAFIVRISVADSYSKSNCINLTNLILFSTPVGCTFPSDAAKNNGTIRWTIRIRRRKQRVNCFTYLHFNCIASDQNRQAKLIERTNANDCNHANRFWIFISSSTNILCSNLNGFGLKLMK